MRKATWKLNVKKVVAYCTSLIKLSQDVDVGVSFRTHEKNLLEAKSGIIMYDTY